MPDLHNKRYLVLGGETPPGRAIVIALAERGAGVAIASLTPSTEAEFAINSALNELWALGRQGLALVIDASDAAALRDAVARAERDLGALDATIAIDGAAIADEALEGRRVVIVPEDGTAEEALQKLIADR
ncbi:MAG: SDR family NAD(P)-dependent oxidoreductase [Dehalococcoidia bacterium]